MDGYCIRAVKALVDQPDGTVHRTDIRVARPRVPSKGPPLEKSVKSDSTPPDPTRVTAVVECTCHWSPLEMGSHDGVV